MTCGSVGVVRGRSVAVSMINISPVISPMYRLYWWHESEDTAGCWCDSPTGLVVKYIGQNNNYGSIHLSWYGPLTRKPVSCHCDRI